jgi:D-alanyl-D-alanine dipeptidase
MKRSISIVTALSIFLMQIGLQNVLAQSNIPESIQNPDLVNIMELDSTFVLDIRYATENNFLETVLYTRSACYLREATAIRLVAIQKKLKQQGLGLLLYDCYRPHSVQRKMWEKVPNPKYVANPNKGSQHNRGCAVDVSLVGADGNELEMPTDHDDFTIKAHWSFTDLPSQVLENRQVLREAMESGGFRTITTEWWHYSDPGCGNQAVLDIPIDHLD